MVQAAVPDQPNADRRAVLFELFSSAIDAAEAFASSKVSPRSSLRSVSSRATSPSVTIAGAGSRLASTLARSHKTLLA